MWPEYTNTGNVHESHIRKVWRVRTEPSPVHFDCCTIIRSLWSLEAAHANAADVFIFWLACAATLKDLFSKGPDITGIPNSLAEAVIAIFNKRYAEFFKNEIYSTTFALDPSKLPIFGQSLL